MATLQVVHTIPDPSYTWKGITNVEYECAYDAEKNQTTVTFLEGFFRYYGMTNYVTDATATITVKAADNEESTASATMAISGTTNGGSGWTAKVTPNPVSITVQHSSEPGEKSIVISVDSVINVYITAAGKSTVPGTASETIVMGDRQGMVTIEINAEWKHFSPYIDTGSGWKQYVPYRDTGTGWEICK